MQKYNFLSVKLLYLAIFIDATKEMATICVSLRQAVSNIVSKDTI